MAWLGFFNSFLLSLVCTGPYIIDILLLFSNILSACEKIVRDCKISSQTSAGSFFHIIGKHVTDL